MIIKVQVQVRFRNPNFSSQGGFDNFFEFDKIQFGGLSKAPQPVSAVDSTPSSIQDILSPPVPQPASHPSQDSRIPFTAFSKILDPPTVFSKIPEPPTVFKDGIPDAQSSLSYPSLEEEGDEYDWLGPEVNVTDKASEGDG